MARRLRKVRPSSALAVLERRGELLGAGGDREPIEAPYAASGG